MKTPSMMLICSILVAGCGQKNSTIKTVTNPDYHVLVTEHKDQQIYFCWFVEDNGAGKSGYVLMEMHQGRSLAPDEQLYPTIDSVREAIKTYGGRSPILVIRQMEWVPKQWKVRSLSESEVKEIENG